MKRNEIEAMYSPYWWRVCICRVTQGSLTVFNWQKTNRSSKKPENENCKILTRKRNPHASIEAAKLHRNRKKNWRKPQNRAKNILQICDTPNISTILKLCLQLAESSATFYLSTCSVKKFPKHSATSLLFLSRPKENTALFPAHRLTKKNLNRAAAKYFFLQQHRV